MYLLFILDTTICIIIAFMMTVFFCFVISICVILSIIASIFLCYSSYYCYYYLFILLRCGCCCCFLLLIPNNIMTMQKTLETRRNVDLSVKMRAESETVEEIHLLLTYTFSSKIRRKGVFRLSIVAADAPVSLVALLTNIHATPPRPILSEDEQREKVATELPSSASKSSDAVGPEKAVDGNMRDSGAVTALHSASSSTATAASMRPVRLQKRLHPAGAMYLRTLCRYILFELSGLTKGLCRVWTSCRRRKSPRGAKLAKK